jgi:hypothetical protein
MTAMNTWRNFKTTGRWHKKVGVQNKAGINLKNTASSLPKMSVKHLCTSRPAGREIDQTSTRKALKKITNAYQENPQLYRTRQEINEHIFGTIKRQWGYNHTNLTGLEK